MLKRIIIAVGCLFACTWLASCQRKPAAVVTAEPTPATAGIEPAASQSSQTVWDRIEMAGQPVGYQALTLSESRRETGVVHDGRAQSKIIVRRFGQATTEEMLLASRETADGVVVRVEAKIQSGGSEQHTIGRRVGNQMQWQTNGAGKPQVWETDLPSGCGGFFAIEWSLRQSPMQPGEQRQIQAVVPVINQVADIQLSAATATEPLKDDSSKFVLPIDQTLVLPGGGVLASRLFADSKGEILRSEMPGMQQASLRTNREDALAAGDTAEFDLGGFASVSLPQPLPSGHAAAQAVFRVHMPNGTPSKFFPETEGQRIREIDPNTIEITVNRMQPHRTPTDAAVGTDIQSSLASSALIQPDDEQVQKMATKIRQQLQASGQDGGDAWQLACAVERYVRAVVETKDFSTALASSAEVARSLQGDCTEHAVLTAALCRANQLPARVLIGLVYVASQQAFVFHMWNEVMIGGQWIPLDATIGQGGTGAAHLILARSDLASGDAFSAFLPVMSVIGQLRIDLVSVRE